MLIIDISTYNTGVKQALAALCDEDWDRFTRLFPPAKGKDRHHDNFYMHDKWRVSIEELAEIEAFLPNSKIDVEGTDGLQLTKMLGHYDKEGLVSSNLGTGGMVQIAIADIGLLTIDEVDWMSDACTQQLQDRLDDGWRILAVCPPNAQRRPDYILGRRKTK